MRPLFSLAVRREYGVHGFGWESRIIQTRFAASGSYGLSHPNCFISALMMSASQKPKRLYSERPAGVDSSAMRHSRASACSTPHANSAVPAPRPWNSGSVTKISSSVVLSVVRWLWLVRLHTDVRLPSEPLVDPLLKI